MLWAAPADAGLGRLTADWTSGCPECRTRIERATGTCAAPGAFVEIGNIAPGLVEYIDLSVAGATDYCYQVRHEDTSQTPSQFSAYSNRAGARASGPPVSLTVR